MIDLEKAKIIAQKKFLEYPICSIIDIGEKWAFSYDTGEVPIPGISIITVEKKDGKVAEMPIPPLENLDILDKGKIIWEQ